MTTADVLFSLLGLVAAASAILAVSTRQLVHAALWLTTTMVALSGCYLVLGAELVALVQLLVYVGAIIVLVLFAMMLTREPIGKSDDHTVRVTNQMASVVIASATTGLLLAAFMVGFGSDTARIDAGSNVNLATHLFAQFTWPFEVLSLVLLVALIGALAMVLPLRNRATSAIVTAPNGHANQNTAPATSDVDDAAASESGTAESKNTDEHVDNADGSTARIAETGEQK